MKKKRSAITRLQELDPSWRSDLYDARRRFLIDFGIGRTGVNIRSINTLVGHMKDMHRAGMALDNIPSGKYGPLTKVANEAQTKWREMNQDPRLIAYKNYADAVATELASVFKGGNAAATQEEIAHWTKKVNAASSPEDIKAHIKSAAQLMASRMQAINEQYEQEHGKLFRASFLSESSKMKLRELENAIGERFNIPGLNIGGGLAPTPTATPAATPAATPQPAAPVTPGRNRQGRARQGPAGARRNAVDTFNHCGEKVKLGEINHGT